MKTPVARTALTAGLLMTALGCSSSQDREIAMDTARSDRAPETSAPDTSPADADTASAEVAIPMELDESVDSAWTYLAAKYDADQDGRVSPDEYDRDGGQFERLDRNRDGELTAEDYASRGGRGGMDPAMMRGMLTQRLMGRYFQMDDDADQLSLDELNEAIAEYDADGNATIDEDEFVAASASRPEPSRQERRMIRMAAGDATTWEAMLDGVDANEDEAISGDELIAFFHERDDGDLVWVLNRGRGGRGGRGGGGGSARPSGAPEGAMAPDFALQPPEGGETVTLSSFSNNLPVALIFGSYT